MKTIIISYLIFFIFVVYSCSTSQEPKYQMMSLRSSTVTLGDDEEINMRLYLAQKYHPGNCFGMPGRDNTIYQRKITPELLNKIKRMIPDKSDKECEATIREMERIGIIKTGPWKYRFEFRDGECCTIISYKGNLEIRNDKILEEFTDKIIENVPC
jgi:hypothetical protein